jgi:CubicO group peptidase (beta-lactamase class C family)
MPRLQVAVLRSSFVAVILTLLLVAPAPATRNESHLTRIYRGDDGSLLYTRQVGTQLYGFGEHPDTKLAFVFLGTMEGSTVKDVRWWDVPKGSTRKTRSTMELRISRSGGRLERLTGAGLPASWSAVSPSAVAWPGALVAGFQDPSPSNLRGAFDGPASQAYVAQWLWNGKQEVAGVIEKDSAPGKRPSSVSVFVGTLTAGTVKGTYAEVAKGEQATRQGSFVIAVGAKKTLKVTNIVTRSATFYPDYALDLGVFASTVENALGGGASFGYAWAIAQNGDIAASGAGGTARVLPGGKRVPFTTTTMSQGASTSKTLSAVLLMKVLRERGLSVDDRVAPYLPSCWKRGPGIASLRFRDLLGHTTGFLDSNQDCRADPLRCLAQAIAIGERRTPTGYQNINYALLRAVVPLVDRPQEARAEFESRACVDTNSAINVYVSERFLARLSGMLAPFDVSFSFYPRQTPFACVYDNRSRKKTGACPRPDFYLRAGAGWLSISAVDYVRFLSAFDRGLIVPKSTVEMMKAGPFELGFDNAKGGAAGAYVWKNGACPGSSAGVGCSALAMIFAGDVQAYAMTNSGRNDPGATATTLDDTLQAAFDAALVK